MNSRERTTNRELLNKDDFTAGNRMRLVRLGIGLTVAETAAIMGVKPVTVYGRENGNDSSYEIHSVSGFEDAVGIKRGTLFQDKCSLDNIGNSEYLTSGHKYHAHRGKDGTRAERVIEKIIRQRIADGTYPKMIPAQRELVKEYGYSRQTINKALRPLREEGIILGKSKRGTIVVQF